MLLCAICCLCSLLFVAGCLPGLFCLFGVGCLLCVDVWIVSFVLLVVKSVLLMFLFCGRWCLRCVLCCCMFLSFGLGYIGLLLVVYCSFLVVYCMMCDIVWCNALRFGVC